MGKILIFSRDASLCGDAAEAIHSIGHKTVFSDCMEDVLDKHTADHDAVILDLLLSEQADSDFFETIIGMPNHSPVIIVTEGGDIGLAESAISKGAWDYFQNPPPVDRLKVSVQRAVEFSRKKRSNKPLLLQRCGIVGSSATMRSCLERVAACASNDSNVLIFGETGTGKELFARAIHYNSARREFPFVIVDCAALPDNLVESILFGHEKGAFTTAERKHPGLIRQAHGGTLFLDEVGELPLGIQKSFLRVLQERTFRPVGGVTEVFSDFRLVVATNKDLEQMAVVGAFRQDLWYRLQTVALKLPPLRGRESDIKELLHYFLDRICKKQGCESKGLSLDVLDTFAGYHWPGNVRELINALECTVISGQNDPILYPEHLPTNLRVCCAQQLLDARGPSLSSMKAKPGQEKLPKLKLYRSQCLAEMEKKYLRKLLQISGNNIPQACEISGMSRPRLYAMIQKYRLRE